jgi:hypothetical protein
MWLYSESDIVDALVWDEPGRGSERNDPPTQLGRRRRIAVFGCPAAVRGDRL